MTRRRFTQRERMAIYLAADGKSDLSGLPLEEFHADHVIPFSRGGTTDVLNAQALTPKENCMKSDQYVELRTWQHDFVERWRQSSKDFLLSALPGSGKTIAALTVAKKFLDADVYGRLIVVVPSLNLRDQWKTEAWELFHVSLQSTEFRGTLKTDYQGAVTTYQTVASNALLFRNLCSRQPTMVIFDEIHHAGDQRNWGDAIKSAFEPSISRLCLSGTPFRTDGTPIPFVQYDHEGFCIADMIYDYPRAIRDGVVRVVKFVPHKGQVEYLKDGELVMADVHRDISEEEADNHLRYLINPDNRWVRSFLARAHEELCSLRKDMPEAAGLVLCADADRAVRTANVLKSIIGMMPDIVLSDDEKANSTVSQFRDSQRPWVVAVRQVSEGVDIKRLMILCYLTTTVTELFFRQAVGRIVRNQGTEFDEQAFCFLPEDPRLVHMAEEITRWQDQALKESDEGESPNREMGERSISTVTIINTSEAIPGGAIIEGQTYSEEEAQLIRAIAQQVGISDMKAARARALVLAQAKQAPSNTQSMERSSTPSPEDRANELRVKISRRVGQFSYLTGKTHRDIYKDYFRIDRASQRDMTEEQLRKKLQWIDRQIAQAK